jgi:superfamily II DNA/RNA helicase
MISDIIQGIDVEKKISGILRDLHINGPVSARDFELLSYAKKYHLELFRSYEPKLIKLMGLFYKAEAPTSLIEEVYSIFADSITEETGREFTPVQADAYENILNRTYFSFSAPTSAGKSYLFREIIQETKGDIVIVVPSRALISEYYNLVSDLVDNSVLVLQFIDVINIKHTERSIFIITPERGVELFRNIKRLNVDLLLFDEAQLSEDGIRGMKFDSFVRRSDRYLPHARKVFTHPFVANPEAQLRKHKFENNSDYRLYNQVSVGKIYLSYFNGNYSYFSPHIEGQEAVLAEEDIIRTKLLEGGTVLIYTSKNKIYDGTFMTMFAEYIELCPKVTNPNALEYITRLKEFIGASDSDLDKRSTIIEMMKKGIVIHHGSMPLKARLIIEEFVNNNYARICFSTSTLAQGINMPFDVVWINNFRFTGSEEQKNLDLKNLIGRAGRNTPAKNSFDFGYVVIEQENRNTFQRRLNTPTKLTETSKLDETLNNVEEDQKDIVEAIQKEEFNDELQLPKNQVERLKEANTDSDILYILDNFFVDGEPITGKYYYNLPNPKRTKIKNSFKAIYISHLRRNKLKAPEASVLSTAIPILLWEIQGKSFSEILSLRHAFLSEKDKRRNILGRMKREEITPAKAKEELDKITIRYSPMAESLPNKSLKAHSIFPENTPASNLEYDILVYDTYDYIDKVISLSLRDPLSAAFDLYYYSHNDGRAKALSNYIRYGTNDEIEIWLVRYGFSFDDIDWIKEVVDDIDENEIIFNQGINDLSEEKFEIIERFVN